MIRRIVSFAVHQPMFMAMLLALFVGAGIASFRSLPVEAFPDVTDVQVDAADAGAESLRAGLGARIEKKHFDATHHCWAFRLFSGRERSSDAGEPNGTAGKPIANAIEGAGLHDTGVVVVRWSVGLTERVHRYQIRSGCSAPSVL